MPQTLPIFDERVRILLEVSSDAMFVTTPDGEIVDCNRAAVEMFGCEQGELIGRQRDELVEPGDTRLARIIDECARNDIERQRLTLRRLDGSTFEGEAACVRGCSPDGTERVLVVIGDLSDRRRADEAVAELRDSNELLRALADAAFEAVIMHRNGVIYMANRAAEFYARVPPGALVGTQLLDFIAPESRPLVLAKIAAGDDQPYEATAVRSDGSSYPVEIRTRAIPVELDTGTVRVFALRDLTVRRELEEQLRQAQKMDALGNLAGGIAHDFNNLLSVILSATELAAQDLPAEHPSRAELEDVLRAAERAAELTRQLLAFSRKTVLRPRVIDVGETLEGMRSMLRRLLTEDIELQLDVSAGPARLRTDPGQLEQVVLNLVVNARDAMPKGGRLGIAVELVTLDEDFARTHVDVVPGPHVKISISDSGMGMDAETRARIFEPFFTTKGPSHGTGLGLSTVFGIVKQSGGTIWVESEAGRGTTFTIYLPASEDEQQAPPGPTPTPAISSTEAAILVVEDEPAVRRVVVQLLRRAGYRVVEADGPQAALELVAEQGDGIDLLVTDVVMPLMSGRQLAEKITATVPQLRVLYMSGYTADAIVTRGMLEPGVHLLAKPIQGRALLDAVREALGGA